MFDSEMDTAVQKAMKMNSTKEWLKRAKEVEDYYNHMPRAQKITESMRRDKEGGIAASNFYWGEETGNQGGDQLNVPVAGNHSGETTSDVGTPEMNPLDGCGTFDGDGECNESDVEIDFDPNRGIKIEIGGKVGYIPQDQIPELIEFAKRVSESNDEDDSDREFEDGREDSDDNLPDFSSFMH